MDINYSQTFSMKKPRVELYDINTSECLQKFRGHEQKNYILRPSFGGLNERLVICGSEDTNVYMEQAEW